MSTWNAKRPRSNLLLRLFRVLLSTAHDGGGGWLLHAVRVKVASNIISSIERGRILQLCTRENDPQDDRWMRRQVFVSPKSMRFSDEPPVRQRSVASSENPRTRFLRSEQFQRTGQDYTDVWRNYFLQFSSFFFWETQKLRKCTSAVFSVFRQLCNSFRSFVPIYNLVLKNTRQKKIKNK